MPADVPEYVDPWRRCPGCPTGRLVEGVKDIDPPKPSWRRFDCGHFVDDQARLNALMTPDFRKRYAEALTARCDLPPHITINPDRRAAIVAAVAEAFGMTPRVDADAIE